MIIDERSGLPVIQRGYEITSEEVADLIDEDETPQNDLGHPLLS